MECSWNADEITTSWNADEITDEITAFQLVVCSWNADEITAGSWNADEITAGPAIRCIPTRFDCRLGPSLVVV